MKVFMQRIIMLVIAVLAFANALAQGTPIDLLIRNARVVDGTGSPWFRSDVAINDGRIVEIGVALNRDARQTIDAGRRVLAPGFIDVHTHVESSDRREGVDVVIDAYPYDRASSNLGINLPRGAVSGGTEEIAARTFSFHDRGIIRPGFVADLVLFDPAVVADKATFVNPHQYSVGFDFVIVNGVAVVADGELTDERSGRFVKGPGAD